MLFVHTCICANDPKSKIIGSNPNLALCIKQASQTGVLRQLLATRQPHAYNREPTKASEICILEGRLVAISSQKQKALLLKYLAFCFKLSTEDLDSSR